ncbi:SDR family oxidoreductase [Pontibacter sp. G13]|uniref:SDR family oxidoreductase n=1 Tax=Pontibacter sp. G13 TaxID=3074898 RepID=UPI00288A2ECC|nr:SDR family oxidoreductase [Pontibacter sp. G13]WNJ16859.1 SDR family oxidoreductase [Pontibacter sp. G13]
MNSPVVVVTGGAGGLGKSLCERFSQAGAKVVALDVNPQALQAFQEQFDAEGKPALAIACDIRKPEAVRTAFDQISEHFGDVDILINNAGITHLGIFDDTPLEAVNRVMDVNFFGAVNCTHFAMPGIRRKRGTIVVVSSVAGFAPLMGRTAYSASKFALHGFFESLRTEEADTGVHVLMVCPSTIDTGIRKAAMTDDKDGEAAQQQVGKVDTPEEVAEQIFQSTMHRKRQLITGFTGKMSWVIRKALPGLYDKLMINKVKPAIEALQIDKKQTDSNLRSLVINPTEKTGT